MTSVFLFLPPQFPDDLQKSSTIFTCSLPRESITGANVGKIQQATSRTHMPTYSLAAADVPVVGIESLLRKSHTTESPSQGLHRLAVALPQHQQPLEESSQKSPWDVPFCSHQYLSISCGTGTLITSTSCWCHQSVTHASISGELAGATGQPGIWTGVHEGTTLIYSFSSALRQDIFLFQDKEIV